MTMDLTYHGFWRKSCCTGERNAWCLVHKDDMYTKIWRRGTRVESFGEPVTTRLFPKLEEEAKGSGVSTLEEEEKEEGHASMETVEPANKTISENNPNMQKCTVNGKTRGKCKLRRSSENSAGEVKSQKDQLDCSANYVLVFCHLEMLRFSVSAELHITQVSLFLNHLLTYF